MQKRSYARRRTYRRKAHARFYIIIGALIVALGVGIFFIVKAVTGQPGTAESPSASVVLTPPDTSFTLPPIETPSEAPPTESPTPTPEPTMSLDLIPQAIAGKTDPATFKFETELMVNGTKQETYQRETPISFGTGSEYTALEGVITFRGNNYRNAPSWGTADITEQKLTVVNTKQSGAIGNWGGFAWTGQPLVVKWPADLRSKMTSLYEKFRNQDGFVEVIAPSLDGNIYFEELLTGDKTRDAIKVGAPIKGTPSLDPRGYPILYVGQGVGPKGGTTDDHMYFRAFSLIDGKLLMKVGSDTKDPFANRNWQAYDSSPLIDAETDTLIQPGENGVIYVCKLNSSYDPATGVVKMDMEPDKVKYRYTSTMNKNRDKKNGGRWGTESSIVTWRNYMIFTDNAGVLQCVDLNTMKLVYANDLKNDSDVSMVLEEDPVNQTFYLYGACEYDDEAANKDPGKGTCYAYKINGLTGEIIWEIPYNADSSNTKVDGGILASPVLGKEGTSMAGLIIYNITAEVKGNSTTSRLVALDKETGTEKWSYDMDISGWSPSSPVPVYTAENKGYIIQCDRNGDIALIDGATGTAVYTLSLKVMNSAGDEVAEQNNFEATPVVFDNMIIVGSRSKNLFFIKIS